MLDVSKRLINEEILFAINHLKTEVSKTSLVKKKRELCECIEVLSKAYKNINNESLEETNNEKI